MQSYPATFPTIPLLGVSTFPISPSFSYSSTLVHIVAMFRAFIRSPLPAVTSFLVSFIHPLFMNCCEVVFRCLYVYPVFPHVVVSSVFMMNVHVQKTVVGISTRFRPLSVPLQFFLIFTLFACKPAALYIVIL